MISCLMFNDFSQDCSTRIQTIEQLLPHVEMKKESNDGSNTTTFYMYDTERRIVWQTVLNLEMEDIVVGYGFGHDETEARRNAHKRLCVLLIEHDQVRK